MIAAAAGAGAGLVLLTETFSTGFAIDRARPRRARGRSVGAVPRRAGREHGVWVGGSCPEIAAGAPADDQRPSNTLRARRARRHDAPLPQDPSVLATAARSSTSAPATELVTVDVEGFRVSLFVCYDLRFADEFWQLAGRHRRLPRAGELAGEAPRCTGWRCCRRGRSRTRPTSSASTGSARATASPTRATAGSSTRSASCWRRRASTESILLADISADHVAQTRVALPLPPRPPLTAARG